jgi:hypothetical protein
MRLALLCALVACHPGSLAAERPAASRVIEARVIRRDGLFQCQHVVPEGGYGCYTLIEADVVSPPAWRGRHVSFACRTPRAASRVGDQVRFVTIADVCDEAL